MFVCWNSYKGHYEGQELHHSIRPEQPRGSREQLAADGERSGAPACLDLQYSFSCQHGQEPGKPAAQFQGYVILRTCKPGRPMQAALLRLSHFVWKRSAFPNPLQLFQPLIERRSSASQFVLHIFHLLKFYSHPKVPIHRARIPAYIFYLCHLQSSRTPRLHFSTGVLPVYSCSGKTIQFGLNLKVCEGY